MIILYLYIFAVGACVGSLLTAWTWRLWNGRSMVEKHSVCPHCGHELRPRDLVPIFSFLLLRGRCRYCGQKIGLDYLLIELATASIFTLAVYQIINNLFLIVVLQNGSPIFDPWALFSVLVILIAATLFAALFIFDLKWGYLPDVWTLGGSICIAIATIAAVVLHKPLLWQSGLGAGFGQGATLGNLASTLLSGVVAALFFLAIVEGSKRLLHKEGMGLGDVKLALFMGLFLGFPGIIVALYLAFILGAVLSLLLLAAKQKSFGQAIPFGPFLVAGTMLAWWLSPQIVYWYQHLLI